MKGKARFDGPLQISGQRGAAQVVGDRVVDLGEVDDRAFHYGAAGDLSRCPAGRVVAGGRRPVE